MVILGGYMKIEENTESPFIEFGKVYKNPDYKSELVIGHLTIRLEKRFNWLNRLMFKLFFGVKITNIENISKECRNCKNYKTMQCPNSSECWDTEDKPYFRK